MTIREAEAELTTIAAGLERTYPETNRNQRFAVRTELQARIAAAPPIARCLLMLTLLAALVLFVSCAGTPGIVDQSDRSAAL